MCPEVLTVDEGQILRHSGAGPRYTSYPTVPVWSDTFGHAEAEAAYRRAGEAVDEPLSVYVHVPFCERRCLFCGCTVEITRREDRVVRYLETVEKEVEHVAGGVQVLLARVVVERVDEVHRHGNRLVGVMAKVHLTPIQEVLYL